MKNIDKNIELHNKEVDANYEAFKKELPKLMKGKEKGKYALLHNCQIKGFFADSDEALSAGNKRFHDKPFSIQKVDDKPVDLGIFSLL